MNNELNQIESQISKILLILGCISLILIVLITILVIIIYYRQNNRYNPTDMQELSSNSNQFNISKSNKQKEHYEFKTLQNTSVPVIKENSLSECHIGSLNAEINLISQKNKTNTLQTKTSQIVEEASSKKKTPISFRSDYSGDDQEDNKDLEKAIDKDINKYIPQIHK